MAREVVKGCGREDNLSHELGKFGVMLAVVHDFHGQGESTSGAR